MQVLAFPRGNIYTILCQDGQQALRIQADDPKQFNNARIVGTGYNPSDLNQLFMIEKVGLNDDEY